MDRAVHQGTPDRARDEPGIFNSTGRSAVSDPGCSSIGYRGRKVGKAMTSRIDGLSVEQHDQPVDADAEPAARRQPIFQRRHVILVERLRLLVAAARARICASKRSRWSCGSLSSEKALAISQP